MACTQPLTAWPPIPSERSTDDNGKRDTRFVFSPMRSYSGARPVELPCGHCHGCLGARASAWAIRMTHEAKLHPAGTCWFITLTYAPEFLPWDGSLSVGELQRYNKRARKEFGGYRFYACGEYGSRLGRPHYHLCTFGQEIPDIRRDRDSVAGDPMYRSERLQKVWPYGDALIGRLTPRACGYVAGYCNKKQVQLGDDERYSRVVVDPNTGWPVRVEVEPEFATMSNRPGLGTGYYERFGRDVFPSDFVIVDGAKWGTPRFYLERLKAQAAVAPGAVKTLAAVQRRRHAALHTAQFRSNNTERRLLERTRFNVEKVKRAERSMDAET